MSHVRITATHPDGTVVDRQVEIRNDQCLESALAKAWSDVLGGRCAARQVPEQEPPPEGCVTLHAYEGPLVDAGDAAAQEAAAASRVIGRFQVVLRRRRPRSKGGWHGAEGPLRRGRQRV